MTIRLTSIDDSMNFPTDVRAQAAANLADTTTVEGAALATRLRIVRGNGLVALGDSISTAADQAAGGAGYGAAWPHLACALSGQRLNFMGNGGVAGQNSTQILARVPAVIALNPQIVTVLAGTNDLTQGVTFATWSANITAAVAQLQAANIRVVLVTIPPRGNTTYLSTQLTWNRWLRVYAQQHHLDLLDFFGLLVDPLTGMYKSGYDSGDGLHPSQAAHVVIAGYVGAQLATSPFAPISAQVGTGDTGNMLANPLLAGTGTPTSWITGGVTSADYAEGVVTDTDFLGQAWQVAYTSATATTNFRQFKSFAISTGFTAGDVLLMCARVKVTASSSVVPSTTAGLRLQMIWTGGTPSSYTPVGADATIHGSALMWFFATVPTGTTSFQISTIVGTIPVGANFTARVGEFGAFNLTTGNLLSV